MNYIILGLLLITNFCYAKSKNVIVEVNNSRELIKSLGSNRIINLKSGKYNISLSDTLRNLSAYFSEGDGPWVGFEFHDLENVEFIGKGKVDIIVNDRYSWVTYFRNCKKITFKNLQIGHEVEGECMGGAACFNNSSKIEMINVGLYGCGTTGLELDGVENFKFSNSEVFNCTYHLANIENSKNIHLMKSIFRNSGVFEMLSFNNDSNVIFDHCEFINNAKQIGDIWKNVTFLDVLNATNPIDFKKCNFNNNKYSKFCNDLSPFRLISCTFNKNDFGVIPNKTNFGPTSGGIIFEK
jgi:hypothetical protein